MNDFTKGELEILKWCVRQAAAHNPPTQGSTFIEGYTPMIKKIQSLIDNHPENIKKKWVFIGVCHMQTAVDYERTQNEINELASLNISTKPYDTKNEMLDAVIQRCIDNKDLK